jgi:crotonobetainyl-CoA:carnitine CoA-transferase CaiB-like acyl-CoA transferase
MANVQSEDGTRGVVGSLEHIRVLELGGRTVQHCGKLLADLGADVIKIEPPDGDSARSVGPFAGDILDRERSLYFLNFNTNKRSAVLDLNSEQDRQRLFELARRVDVVLEGFGPGYLSSFGLGFEDIRKVNPDLVFASITGFGQTGPHAQFAFSDLVGGAMGGIMTSQGDPDYPPCNAPMEQAYQMAGLHGALGVIYALYNRPFPENGVHVDISVQDVLAHIGFGIPQYDQDHDATRGARRGAPGVELYPTKDGWAHVYSRNWRWIVEWIGNEVLNDPRWNERQYRTANAEQGHRIIEEFTSQFTGHDLMMEAQRRGLPSAVLSTTEDFIKSPHITARGFFREMEHPALGKHRYPGPPYTLTQTPVQFRQTAPLLGQDTADVMGLLEQEPVAAASSARQNHAEASWKLPFLGVRVLEFTIAFAGPFAARYLAELGAEVIKFESMKFPSSRSEATDGFRVQYPGGRGGNFGEINRSKKSVAMDLHLPEAQALVLELAKTADVVLDNFSPGTLKGWNLGYADFKKVKPDIIMAEMPGFGVEGPHGHFVSLGQTLASYSGLMRLWGHPGSPENTRSKLAYIDWVGAGHTTLALVAALNHRKRTGEGQYIEVAQVEAGASLMGVGFLDYLVNNRIAEPLGNRHVSFAPYNAYPCLGDDRWCVISVETDVQWEALVKALGGSAWAKDSQFSTREGRKAAEDELDQRLGEWTRERTPHQVMYTLQKAGVPAAAVQNREDLFRDYHLRQRGYTVEVEQPYIGKSVSAGLTIRFEGLPETQPRGAPYLGQDNEYVYTDLLGLTPEKIRELTDKGVLV